MCQPCASRGAKNNRTAFQGSHLSLRMEWLGRERTRLRAGEGRGSPTEDGTWAASSRKHGADFFKLQATSSRDEPAAFTRWTLTLRICSRKCLIRGFSCFHSDTRRAEGRPGPPGKGGEFRANGGLDLDDWRGSELVPKRRAVCRAGCGRSPLVAEGSGGSPLRHLLSGSRVRRRKEGGFAGRLGPPERGRRRAGEAGSFLGGYLASFPLERIIGAGEPSFRSNRGKGGRVDREETLPVAASGAKRPRAPPELGSVVAGKPCRSFRGVPPLLGDETTPSRASQRFPGSGAGSAPEGGAAPRMSGLQDEYVWRLSRLLGPGPASGGEPRPPSSDSICTEDFAAHFQEATVEAELRGGRQEGACPRSPESLGGHIARLSRGSPLSSWGRQQPPGWDGAAGGCCPGQALPEAPGPRLGPVGGRAPPRLGGPFPEKWGAGGEAGAAPAGSQSRGVHSRAPLSPSPHHGRAPWDPEPPLKLPPHGPAREASARRQLSRPLAGTQDPRLPLSRWPASPWEPEPPLPSCPLGYRAPGSHREKPSPSHPKGLKKEQEIPGDPKPWKWSQDLERMKDGGPGRLVARGAHAGRRADSGRSGQRQQPSPETPGSGEAPGPGSPGAELELLGALIGAARRRLWAVDRQAESLQEAVRELQRLAPPPGGRQDPESPAAGQTRDGHGGAGLPGRRLQGLGGEQAPSPSLTRTPGRDPWDGD
ncbi:collagen alpha-1(I) chain-like [Antechinus flavipes]|uniref:collagen alpha-1(I) chain-like n=1 Tax=Antechinus flavipes TaxID=38775 RepID=UPI002235EEC4|nr:collagen alpha-1(I) chain-like [Antechinus flavipes]